MLLLALPAFTDNYIWMLHDGRQALVVDPGEAEPVQAALQSQGLRLAGILVTHHHGDHTGGVDALRPLLEGPVFGPARERIPQPFTPLRGGDTASLLSLDFQVIDVPGHTAGHIAYYLPGGAHGAPILFCGDTLFSAGCGRLFEGTPAQMQASLAALSALPDDTRVCCAHEYTLSNLRFAAAVEPDNSTIAQHRAWCENQRAHGGTTLPSSLALERQINPFLRLSQPDVVRAAQQRRPGTHGDVEVLATLREWKNGFQ
ncbi:hydroxyacylglutathione hydrolase [Azohydromonas caseinilytica]|uniref:Hydroxyacylglutathione hydrolase n=1 Tax=Azohydromonas caseinilytica TaxID=2728836 RepID=A0A848FAN2_9BURK|nr:hydroxyacylglutathione hydrolase [Azohydromonas caseinilytica]NML15383.1 hydroxyacylglutathione hydrolase [Azohydromonas caseinilytica]